MLTKVEWTLLFRAFDPVPRSTLPITPTLLLIRSLPPVPTMATFDAADTTPFSVMLLLAPPSISRPLP